MASTEKIKKKTSQPPNALKLNSKAQIACKLAPMKSVLSYNQDEQKSFAHDSAKYLSDILTNISKQLTV